MSHGTLNKKPHCRYLSEFWTWFTLKGRKNICIFGNVKHITNNSKKRNSGK